MTNVSMIIGLSPLTISSGTGAVARRVKSLTNALEPFKKDLDSDTFNKLITTASVLMGIDSLIVCKDVCDLNNEETNATKGERLPNLLDFDTIVYWKINLTQNE